MVGAVSEGLDLETRTGLWVDYTPTCCVIGELSDTSVGAHVRFILLLFNASTMSLRPGIGHREMASFLKLISGHKVRIFHSLIFIEVLGNIKTATCRIKFLKNAREGYLM